MSGLINSYLVEPVIRQARRGSTPADEAGAVGTATSEADHQPSMTDQGSLYPSHATPVAARENVSSDLMTSFHSNDTDTAQDTLPGYGFSSLLSYSRDVIGNLASRGQMYTTRASSSYPSSSVRPSAPRSITINSIPDMARRFSADSVQRLRTEHRTTSSYSDRQGMELNSSSRQISLDQSPIASREGSSMSMAMSSRLPDDDGMRTLRDEIHRIREMALSSEEKAQRMHALMVADYEAFKAQTATKQPNQDFLVSPSIDPSLRPASAASYHSQDHHDLSYISLADRKPSYAPQRSSPNPNAVSSMDSEDENGADEILLGCQHYLRNVKIQCRDCKKWYTCRHCHDLAEAHSLDRKGIRNMLCMLCGHAQKAGEYCERCGELTAAYYCDICKLWENDSNKSIYHCLDCGICRRGEGLGKDYLHCKKCNVCISIAWINAHRCLERATECDCPICNVWMFTSSDAVVSMRCGHYIHRQCYEEYMDTSYKCPICNRSAVNMELQWRKLDEAIQAQPMPSQFSKTKVWITCNDCAARTCTNYHWLGNKCNVCDSYNTNQIKIINSPSDEEMEAVSSTPEAIALREMERNINESDINSIPQPLLRDEAPPSLPNTAPEEQEHVLEMSEATTAHVSEFANLQLQNQQNTVTLPALRRSLGEQPAVLGHSFDMHNPTQHSPLSRLNSREIAEIENEPKETDEENHEDDEDDDVGFWGEGLSPSSWSMPMSISPMSGWTSPGFFATRMGLRSGEGKPNEPNRSLNENNEDDNDEDDWSTEESDEEESPTELEDGDVDDMELLGHR